MLDKAGKIVLYPFFRIACLWRALCALQYRECRRLRNELLEVQHLVPLLMKPRNGERWSGEERREIRQQLQRMTAMSPYLMLFVMPGGLLLLPLLAWWLDRRRRHRRDR